MQRFLYTILLIAILLGFTARVGAELNLDDFYQKAESEFQLLLALCPKDRASHWQERRSQALQAFIDKTNELQQVLKIIEKDPNREKIKQVFAFTYLNAVNEVQLETRTKLVEDLGRELLRNGVNEKLTSPLTGIEMELESLRSKSTRESLLKAYSSLLEVKRFISRIEQDVPVKYKYVFMPKANAYSSAPERVVEYVIHDWPPALKNVDEYRARLVPIQDVIKSVRFFTPKDPLPWLSIAAQLSILLIAMGGWIKSYHGDSYWAIGILVVPSMVLSVFLVFYSDETVWNIVGQSILPGLFILYWIARANKWWDRFRNVLGRFKKSSASRELANQQH